MEVGVWKIDMIVPEGDSVVIHASMVIRDLGDGINQGTSARVRLTRKDVRILQDLFPVDGPA